MRISDGQPRRWDGLERKLERQDWGGLDMYEGNGYMNYDGL